MRRNCMYLWRSGSLGRLSIFGVTPFRSLQNRTGSNRSSLPVSSTAFYYNSMGSSPYRELTSVHFTNMHRVRMDIVFFRDSRARLLAERSETKVVRATNMIQRHIAFPERFPFVISSAKLDCIVCATKDTWTSVCGSGWHPCAASGVSFRKCELSNGDDTKVHPWVLSTHGNAPCASPGRRVVSS
ncbi:hypothetical protein K491DRAFT_68678 [Lophiostoma macrostomum CBS 122681]|uniref:Uncharacterized protein n=1 Tax=Lophiostoma macrostomum CBS 122681 TaxID=1314788 RepID=A0A6A6T0L1_9PLEO|nr:hypothetical protein K491DRAFT_68678 [Lophiostoma macrostomum CBS 122681]